MRKKLYYLIDGETPMVNIAADTIREAWEKAIPIIADWEKEDPIGWQDIDLHIKQFDVIEV